MPHKIINRMLAIFWIVVSLFFISTLTAKITTALTVAELKTDNSTYIEAIDGVLLEIQEEGIYAKLHDKYFGAN